MFDAGLLVCLTADFVTGLYCACCMWVIVVLLLAGLV